MAIPDMTRENLQYFVERLNRIRSVDQRRWGQLGPAALLRHLRFVVESTLEGGPTPPDKSIPGIRVLARWIFFHLVTTWPKGIKAPKEVTPDPQFDLDVERTKLVEAIERFINESGRNPERTAVNVLLGPLTIRYFAHVHGVHFHHHFRQYGVV